MIKAASLGLLLEAEVQPHGQSRFEKRYFDATGVAVSPGSPVHYQNQNNKWGMELRVYFNEKAIAASLSAMGLNVEKSRDGYRSGEYIYRVNNNKFWWNLVEISGLRLGLN